MKLVRLRCGGAELHLDGGEVRRYRNARTAKEAMRAIKLAARRKAHEQRREAELAALTAEQREAHAARQLDRLQRRWQVELTREEKQEKLEHARREHCRIVRRFVFKHLRRMGFKREHLSRSGSAYYEHPCGERVRVSDHDVPLTPDREQAAWTWARHGWTIDVREHWFAAARVLVEIRRSLARLSKWQT